MDKDIDKVKVTTSQGEYDVIIGSGLNVGELLGKIHDKCHILLVSDDTVAGIYESQIKRSLKAAGFTVDTYIFAHGEENKTIANIENILEKAADIKLTRSDLMLALGGGVVGDMTGFASAVYLRGIDFVQVPTTVLAAVDSSVGGKTGCDLKAGKNLAGAFHQPIGVFLDTDTFKSLPKEIYAEGMAEAIKYGMIMDYDLFETFESDDYSIREICRICIEHKAKIVKKDEFEKDIRRILNFGHTPAHGIEKLSQYKVSHGNAVSIGMVIMTRISEKKGMLPEGSTERLKAVLQKQGLPVECRYNDDSLAKASLGDKKRTGDTINIVLLNKIGKAVIVPIPITELDEYYEIGLGK